MICWAVPSSLGPKGWESFWADPLDSDWDEGAASRPAVGSDKGMTSMASAAEGRDQHGDVVLNMKETFRTPSGV